VTAINQYNPEWVDDSPDSDKLVSALIDSVAEHSDEIKNYIDPKEEALQEITRENCKRL